ncbi:MAG: hypothetical protein EOP22_15575 [Hyphomicrobiales bacterium]|nr:MAG: hypothetical protein EOP22_15575 [Hyphomicrobiales bacterium]
MIANPAKSPAKAARAVLTFGLVVIAAALVWWLAYYSQYNGLSDLGAKFACFSNDAPECGIVQSLIGSSAIPVYSPMLLWAGLVVSLVGLYLTRRHKA